MKKLCSLLLILCLIFSLSACGGNETATDNDTGSFCTECGEEISATDKFCGSCGASVEKSTTDNSTTNTTQNNDSSNSVSIDVPSSTTSKPTTTTKPETSKPTTTTKPNTPTHTHSYSGATCTAPAKCSCGATKGSALGHSYSNGVCSRCGGTDSNYVKTYSIGETWVVDGQWEFTVNSVTTHSLCNSYSNEDDGYTNEQVIIIDYTFKNIGYEDEILNLYICSAHFNVYDGLGEAATTYPCTHLKHPNQCIVGMKSKAQEAYVLSNKSASITLMVYNYTSNGKGKASANFNLKVN